MSDQIPFVGVGGSAARFSEDGAYRYELSRRWAKGGVVAWIMLNPSTADASVDDSTIRRCISFARAWGFGGLAVANLFGFRATDPRELALADDPVGPDNDEAVHDVAVRSRLIVAAWGTKGGTRADAVLSDLTALRPVYCLGLTKAGHPRHPLYVRADTRLSPVPARSLLAGEGVEP